ncbi:hypothetical protein [Nocardia carnea]|uniref:hypothetical protein n=1 Tax=Nocardia carnea TaxID=37328 RepID=UPI002454A45A|nr:hypothetical protein [Nocardia carnea]
MDTLGLMCRGTGAVVALAVVFWVRPSAELEEFLRQSWSSAVQGLLGSASVTRLWPIALFGITILVVVIRQSAVIDNIRARDEAAKDANRLLAELCGALLRTEYQLLLWSRWLKWQTESPLIQVRVERFTDGAYSWTEGRLQPSEDAPRDATGPEAELDRYQTELAATLDDVTEVCRKITASGLTTVCLRMTNPIRYASEEALGLFNPYRFPNPMASPGAGPATIRDRLDRTVSGWPCRHFDPADRNYDAVDEGSLNSAEREAFKFRAELYEMAYELAVTICWCHLVARRLNRRIYGTLLPRFAGAVTK